MLGILVERATWISFALSLIYLGCYNWYDSFYHTLEKQQAPYRLLQVWVQADRPNNQTSPIGGSHDDYQQWAHGIEYFLSQAVTRPTIPVQVDFIADAQTVIQHQELFDHWAQSYPHHFNLIPLSQILLPEHEHYEFLHQQCAYGIAASCSDFLRTFFLEKPGVTSAYMDIDTLIYRLKHQKKPFAEFDPDAISSQQAYGLLQGDEGVFVGMSQKKSKQQTSVEINNDCVISKPRATMWPLIYAQCSEQIARYSEYMTLLNQRRHINDYEHYSQNLAAREKWAQAHPYQNINQLSLVVQLAGPAFWKNLCEKEVVDAYQLPHLPSGGGWMNGSGCVRGQAPYAVTEQLFNKDISQKLLTIMLMSHDLKYYQKKEAPWAGDLEQEILHLWAQISDEEKSLAEKVFQSPMKWVKELENAVA